MDLIDMDVQESLKELIEKVVAMNTSLNNAAPGSPPTDLAEDWSFTVDQRSQSKAAGLEFFCDIFDIMPTQFYASQRELPRKMGNEFLVPQPSKGPFFRQTQDIVESRHPVASEPTCSHGQNKEHQFSNPDISPTQSVSEAHLKDAFPMEVCSQFYSSQPESPPKMGNEFLVPQSPNDPFFPCTQDLVENQQSSGMKSMSSRGASTGHKSSNSNVLSLRSNSEMHSKGDSRIEFCPPCQVGAYSTAPLYSHANRSMRIGLSRTKKRRRDTTTTEI